MKSSYEQKHIQRESQEKERNPILEEHQNRFSMEDGQLSYKKKSRLVILDKDRQRNIIHNIHEGSGDSSHSKAMSAHLGRNPTYENNSARCFWYGIYEDVSNYVQKCNGCQKQRSLSPNVTNELHSVPVSPNVMKQVGADLCSLPEGEDGCCHLIVCIDYFSKWTEAKPIKDKTAVTVVQFLYELMRRHGCVEIQINDQGREFVNAVSTNLHELTGIEQRVTSACHPQSNGLVERQNRTIKNALVKVLNEKPTEWPYIIEGILFAHRVSRHSSAQYSPFYLLYNREPILPIGVKFNLADRSRDF